MDPITVLVTSVALAMDAFAVSITLGLRRDPGHLETALKAGIFFGMFQGLMAFGGWMAGAALRDTIADHDHWAAFLLLALIGGKMIHDSIKHRHRYERRALTYVVFFLLAVATSIDALMVGISLSLVDTSILFTALSIGVVAFIFSFFGVMMGRPLGRRFGRWSELAGGLILIGIGVKVLLDHLA